MSAFLSPSLTVENIMLMRARRVLLAATSLATSAVGATAQEPTTVQSLLRDEFAIVGTQTVTGGGAALFLQKKDQLFFCYATETRESRAVVTQYCKPVQ